MCCWVFGFMLGKVLVEIEILGVGFIVLKFYCVCYMLRIKG